MNLLLDTHVAIWALATPERLGRTTVSALTNPRNLVAVSSATVWEVEIKRSLGKLDAPDRFADECLDRGFDELAITFEHAVCAGQLPQHHRDPFDRMLIGQAIVENLTIVTADSAFDQYGVQVMSAER